ncbi:MAG TPA: nuclear transport factor 2 family protein [Gemmatimonadales bacterium]|nr:nuclear transport factor 2 family protein [Gemmatimonadales bacterium]
MRILFITAAMAALPAAAPAQSAADSAGVRAAVLDYVEGFYQGDSTRLVRSIRPEVVKYGFYVPRDSSRYQGEPMSFAQMHAFANSVKRNNRPAPATAPREIELLDVQDQTAAAKLTAWWGTDYLHLAKYDGRWMIVHVLWQSPPRES